ncbi:DNA polymerase III gamma subunit /DNA polymerase III tau subunit [Cricetibacter osteomyelitidis]|uniref:DNA polymerase III subunit gamma/tau n=1 Tax=Cricetibacter osteomyelitidis TaxID=1521931 RepID=A0A4R2T7Y6_9PAST|nr:DNA polymerase III subunit gamma/tau [Cricetibacter osteomyelitidis]TCP97676.1 DNA polymerase III gamma subunit /DNA polymerase III tau subunit [Cricetibacter osteomyelitidis]
MSYQVLARKWRPKKFSEVVGQQHILTALANGLKENRLHHAYLFSGTRGVGKTSIARLFAKGLNCVHGVTAEPCGECAHCKAIEEGSFIDLIEIDAASRTKVEDTRELLDNVQYKPVQGRYKVYLIDEVHMLSRHSFNALLKTLEEPPEYVKFLLATTDPQKLPITILSRCMQFHLKALDQSQIAQHLDYILTQEKIPFESTALDKLAKAAQGSIRDSLSLTDQAIVMSNGNITTEVVNTMLGLLDDEQPIEIVRALQQANGEALMTAIQKAADRGVDWEQLLVETASVLHQIAMQQLLPQNNVNDGNQISFLASHISPEDVQLFYQIIVLGRKELALAPDRRAGVEMTLLRALAFHPKSVSATAEIRLAQPSITQNANNSVKSAVKNTQNLVDMPVISDGKITKPSQSIGLAALEQLQKLNSQTAQEPSPQKEAKVTELPVVSTPPKRKTGTDLLERFAKLATQNSQSDKGTSSISETTADDSVGNDNDEIESDENYRWEWSNPELAKDVEQIRPSEIKQAILNKRTPELVAKILMLSEAKDPWEKTISDLGLDKLVKQLALNSVILQQTDSEIKLGLRSSQAHLNKESSVAFLQNALSEHYQKQMQVSVEIYDEQGQLTPLENRRQIYLELREQARIDLQQDEKLKMLEQEFDGKLDLSSIVPNG